MQLIAIFRILGLLLMLLSINFVPPLLIEAYYQEGHAFIFKRAFFLSLSLGLLLWFPVRTYPYELRTQASILIIAFFWLISSLMCALPFYLSNISFTDALFEAVSGLTTTGSTVFAQLNFPHSLLFYRQQLQFIGGVSIIMLVVAILPILGTQGIPLFRIDTSGPIKNDKPVAHFAEIAKFIWFIYLLMNVVCTLCYWLAGMNGFDAITQSFATVSTGGFFTHDNSIHYFEKNATKIIGIVFMILSAINFNLHYLVIKRKKLHLYWRSPEVKLFLRLIIIATLLICLMMITSSFPFHFLDSLFQVVSCITTTGFISTDFSIWPGFSPLLLIFCAMMGGCASSTSGGIKLIRILLLQKLAAREMNRLIHPHGQYVIKLNENPIHPSIIEAVGGFFIIYIMVFIILLLLLLTVEKDFLTAFSALSATLSNMGPALGRAAAHFGNLSDFAKWILTLAMLLGRLEIFTLLVLLSPQFWRR